MLSIVMSPIYLASRIANYKLARHHILPPAKPITLTFSVTNRCNSRCSTCYIWQNQTTNELSLQEIEKIFQGMGKVFYFNISGGEPFLRKDLPKIVILACKYLKPSVIHTPTNAIASDIVIKTTNEILKRMKQNGYSHIQFTIKPSFDGIGEKHDKIRGVPGNFKLLMKTILGLKELQKEYPFLHVGIGTVISRFNVKEIPEIASYAKKLNMDSYIHEIAESRSELFNTDKNITPDIEDYAEAVEYFINEIKSDFKNKRRLSKVVYAFRIVYYRLVLKIMKEKRQVIPCYAGLSNIHMTPDGKVWPCCILGYKMPMGDLRQMNYSIPKILASKRAGEVREFIRKKKCYCPLANQAYSNLICNTSSIFKIAREYIAMSFFH